MTELEAGRLLDELPYVRAGGGQRTLVVIPGFGDSMFAGEYPPAAAWLLRRYYHWFADNYTVQLISRPRGLPRGYSIADAVEQYALVLEETLGAVDVLGLSMGGFVGQELAARYPDLVEKLVVTVSGRRVAENGRETVRRWLRYAREEDWFSIRSELAREFYADWRRFALPPVIHTTGRLVLPRPAVPSDVSRSLEAILRYDGTERLGDIEAPTLVIGGSEDRFFPESILRETADGIADGRARPIAGAKHGAFDERKYAHDTAVKEFLDG
ncbi:alpha/beta fold hydrolase [Haloferacaceae archaeon DSL9]